MKLQFRQLRIRNFKAFLGPVLFNLTKCGIGLHFVRGRNKLEPSLHSNGAGKSSLWDALCWCLYGRTVDNLRNPDIKPWVGPKETGVTLWLRCDEDKYNITRTTFPNCLTLNGKVVGQETIDKLLGLNFDTFTHTVLMGQGRPLFFELAPRDKLDLFTVVLDLDAWERRSDKAAAKTREYDDELIRLGSTLDLMRDRLSQLKEQITQARLDHDKWEMERFQYDLARQAEVKELERQRDAFQREREAADLDYDSAMIEIKGLRREKAQLDDLLEASKEQREAELRAFAVDERELDKLQERLDRDLPVGEICESCGQKITGKGLVRHRQELKRQVKALQTLQLSREEASTLSQLNDLRQQLARNKESSLRFQERADAANDCMIHLDPRLAETKAKLEQVQASKADRERAENPFDTQLAQLRSQRGTALDKLREAKGKINETNKLRERTVFWIKGFKEVRLFVIEEILLELEVASNALLDQFGLMGWAIRYNIERETQSGNVSRALNVEIMSPQNTSPVKFESWSGGQQQRLRLIGSLALSDVLLEHAGIRASLEILDEPSRSITPLGVRDMVEALANRAAERQTQIYYTDHSAVESSRFTSTIDVIHDDTGAHL